MFYEKEVKSTLEDVRTALPDYIFGISDINEALERPSLEGKRGGNCGVVSYLGLSALEDKLRDVPGFFTQFGFMPHVLKENSKITVGHALGRFEIGGSPYIFNQTRDGKILIGKPEDFKVDERTLYYPTEEGYSLFVGSLYKMRGEAAPIFDRDEVMEKYREVLAVAKTK